MATNSDSEEKFNWLYPDLLSETELISILSKRYIKVTNIELLSKDELVDLYNTFILPLPQRKYRLNRRGRDMTKKQIIRAKKRKNTAVLSPASIKCEGQPEEKMSVTGHLQNNFSPSVVGDRLKPPPSCINFERKTLKLNSSSKSEMISPISSSLNHLKINRISLGTKRDKSDISEIEIKKIRLNATGNNDDAKVEGLKNKVEGDKDEGSSEGPTPMDTSDEKDGEPTTKKRKIKRIAWP